MLTFSNILEKTQDALTAEAIDKIAEIITIIRDVMGKIHIMLEFSPNNHPNEASITQMEHALRQSLGTYYGNDLWIVPQGSDHHSSLVELVRRERHKIDWKMGTDGAASLYLLERHIAKKTWVDPTPNEAIWDYQLVEKGYKPKVISFYSFKGGVGRTTSLAATAIQLSRMGYRVGIIDFDLEAPGAASLFFPPETISFGTIDYLLEKPIHQKQWSIRQHLQVVSDQRLLGDTGEPIHLIPAGVMDESYIEKLARIDFQGITENQLNSVVKDLLYEMGSKDLRLDYILIDARAGFHDIGGMALTQMAHAAVLFGVHSEQTWAGLTHVIRRVANPYGEQPLPVVMVHALAPGYGLVGREQEISAFKERSYDTFLEYYYDEEDVEGVNPNNPDEPFYPIIIPYNELLRGDLSLYEDQQGQLPAEVINLFARQEGPYHQLAEKLSRMFGEEVK